MHSFSFLFCSFFFLFHSVLCTVCFVLTYFSITVVPTDLNQPFEKKEYITSIPLKNMSHVKISGPTDKNYSSCLSSDTYILIGLDYSALAQSGCP